MIYYFGDSHTAGIGSHGSPKPDEWFHVPYSKYLTDMLGIESKNLAKGGKHFLLNIVDLVKNLKEIEENASIVIFQTQFLCNSILKYNEDDFYSKDIVITNPTLGHHEIYENKKFGITKEDTFTILNWSSKFEERRSLYDLDIVVEVFNYLSSKNIKCYLLYWCPGFDIEFPDNKFLIKIGDIKYANKFIEPFITFDDITNGEWPDYHSTNDWNEKLAKKIYEYITKPKNKYI